MNTPSDTTRETVVERVARAICRPVYARMFAGHAAGVIDQYVDINWTNHIDSARAALAAIREPSEGMLMAGASAFEEVNGMIAFCHARGSHRGGLQGGDPLAKAWPLMIAQALSEGQDV